MEELNRKVQYQLYYLIEARKQSQKELKALKKLCEIRMENFEENESFKELSGYLARNKKEIKALKRIQKILNEVSE